MRTIFPSPYQTRLDFCHDMRPLIGCSLRFSRQKSICSTHTRYREHRCLRRDQNHHSNLRCGMLRPNKQSFNSPGALQLNLDIHVRKDNNKSYTLLPKITRYVPGVDTTLLGLWHQVCRQPPARRSWAASSAPNWGEKTMLLEFIRDQK